MMQAYAEGKDLYAVIAQSTPSVGRLIYSWSNFVPTIHVPASAVDTYKGTSPWSNYAESISAIVE